MEEEFKIKIITLSTRPIEKTVKKNTKVKELKEMIYSTEGTILKDFELIFQKRMKDEEEIGYHEIENDCVIKMVLSFDCQEYIKPETDLETNVVMGGAAITRIPRELNIIAIPIKKIKDWNYIVELKIENTKSEFNNFKIYLYINYPIVYPFKPIKFRVITPIFHPLFSQGSIYCSSFGTKWSPVNSLDHLTTLVCCLLEEIDGLNNECPNHFVKDILKDFEDDEKLKVCSFYTSLMNNHIDGVSNRMKYLCKKDKKISLQFLLVLERMKKEDKIVIPRVIRNYIISMFVLQFLEQIKTQFYHPLFDQTLIDHYFQK